MRPYAAAGDLLDKCVGIVEDARAREEDTALGIVDFILRFLSGDEADAIHSGDFD